MRATKLCIIATTASVVAACGKGPLVEGCQYASGLTDKCEVQGGGRWFETPPGFVVEELQGSDAKNAAGAALTREAEALDSAATSLAARVSTDALDRFIISRYLLTYSDRGSINDCVVSGQRDAAMRYVAQQDGNGFSPFLQLSPPSKLTSKVFESVFASTELKARLEADLTQTLGDPAEAKAVADIAFSAMRENLRTDLAVGTYRYVMIRSHPQVWDDLKQMGLLRDACTGKSVTQGILVVGLDKRDQLVERATGANLRAALSGRVDGAKLDQAIATAEASLSAEIRRQSQRTISVTLDAPAIVPLRWKPDRM